MADGLKAALQSKLVAYESAGMTDHAKRVKARLAQLDKPAKAAAPSAPATLSTTVTTTTVTAPKKAAKKAAAKKRTK